MKRVFIIHGWDGYPEEGWFPWLKAELIARGYEVQVPQMPNADNPRMETWIPAIAATVGQADLDTYFVGHSMGCKAIAGYLQTLTSGIKIGGAVFVAGFFKQLTNLEDDDAVRATAKICLDYPVDLAKVKSHLPKSIAIFSDNDPYVPLDNKDEFKKKLGSEIIIEHQQGHFSGSTGTVKLPVALNAMIRLSAR